MGMDAGFDMYPRLSTGVIDRQKWGQFIEEIKLRYQNDPQVEVKSNYIEFIAGEHPILPFEGHKFLRFSSKVTGSTAYSTHVERYLEDVMKIAVPYFGSRVHYWDEMYDQYGEYDWTEVHRSLRSYEKPDSPVANILDRDQTIAGAAESMNVDPLPIFEITNIDGKGKGLIARVDIAEGTQILCEKPLFKERNISPIDTMESVLVAKLKAAPKDTVRRFLSLHNKRPGKHPFSNTFHTNALPCGPGSTLGGIYTSICRINHSCIPNSCNTWNDVEEHETVYAIRPIKAGEEITIPYSDLETRSVRRAFSKDKFGFDCTCRLCALPTADSKKSDRRCLEIKRLDDAIGIPSRKPKDSLKDCLSLLKLLREELEGHIGILGAGVYYDAFQVCITNADRARASVFAERSHRLRSMCEGAESPEAGRMKELARRPEGHYAFAAKSKAWNTKTAMIPQGLDDDEFEKWLFRV